MDSREFDRITRLAAQSRRGVLRALGGGAIAAVAAGLGLREASANKARSFGNACKINADCVSNHCLQVSATRKICGCAAVADCPSAADPCSSAVCNPDGSCGVQTVTCGTGQICAGGACIAGQGTCPTGADFCANTAYTCNGRSDCFCRITTEGDTRCGGNALSVTCGECGSTADCVALFPNVPGVYCRKGGTGCCDGTAPRGFCDSPCPTA